jgi:hypothetical protein
MSASSLQTFEDYCQFFGVHHYGDRKTYEDINFFWKPIREKITLHKLTFPDYNAFLEYLITEHDSSPQKQFIYWYIIRELQKYQINLELYYDNR